MDLPPRPTPPKINRSKGFRKTRKYLADILSLIFLNVLHFQFLQFDIFSLIKRHACLDVLGVSVVRVC